MIRAQLSLITLLAASVMLGASVPAQANLAAAVLPSSRSTEVGNTVTVFSTVINGGTDIATGCGIENQSGLPIVLGYQTTDPNTNSLTGTANTPVDLLAGQAQSFVISITPMAPIDSAVVPFAFSCTSGASAGTITGVNTLLLSASNTPVVDVIALAATGGNTGVLSHDNAAGAFALATINIGAADTVTVAADTGDVNLPVSLSVCETNSATGACLAAPAPSVDVTMPSGAMPTFSVFSQASAEVANDPAVNRVFVRFTDSGSVVRGGTSVALANELIASAPLFTSSAFSVLSRVFELAFGSVQSPSGDSGGAASLSVTPQVDLDQTIPCDMTGQIVMTGSSDSSASGGSSTLMADFQNCDGIDGMLTMVTNIQFAGTLVTFETVQNGSYSADECEEIRMTNIRVAGELDVSAPVDDTVVANAFSTSGTISGTCQGQSFSCSLDNVALQDEEVLAEDCTF